MSDNILGMFTGALQNHYMQADQRNETRALMDLQLQNNMRLAREGQRIQKENWDYTNYENQVKHMENAGLNVGLMYGMGGGGGATMGAGATGSASMGKAEQFNQGATQMALENKMLEKVQAETENVKASTNKIISETPSGDRNLGDMNWENLKQTAEAKWYDNLRTRALREGVTDEKELATNVVLGKTVLDYNNNSPEMKQFNAELNKLASEKAGLDAGALLNNTKAQGYFKELLIAGINAESGRMEAEAKKLQAEFETGKETTWKTWYNIGKDVIGFLLKGAKIK